MKDEKLPIFPKSVSGHAMLSSFRYQGRGHAAQFLQDNFELFRPSMLSIFVIKIRKVLSNFIKEYVSPFYFSNLNIKRGKTSAQKCSNIMFGSLMFSEYVPQKRGKCYPMLS